MRRLTKAVLGGLAGSALVLGGTQAASAALEAKFSFRDALTDLLEAPGPFDSAKAKITVAESTNGSTTFRIHVRGIGPSAVPEGGYGAHLHVNSCDDPAGPGGHYQNNPTAGANRTNEVWFDLVPDEDGVAKDQTTVAFVPLDVDGKMSVVIHVGNALTGGTKQACFPLSVPQWIPAATE
ncbi:MAG TPA: hypothetical protein VIQ76_02635 [Propionibacteriaceae bacterium]